MEAGVVEPAQRKEGIECSVLVVEVEVVAVARGRATMSAFMIACIPSFTLMSQ